MADEGMTEEKEAVLPGIGDLQAFSQVKILTCIKVVT